jgi:hypothetical protein
MKHRLRVLLGVKYLVVYTAKEFYDKIFCSHETLLDAFGFGTYSIVESHAFSN